MFSTYQKPHNRYLYIPYQSHHRSHVFRAFIRGELIRYTVTNSRAADFQQVSQLFWQRLVARGYPQRFLRPIFDGVAHVDRARYMSQQQQQQQQRRQQRLRGPPVFLTVNDQHAHSRINLGKVINSIYQHYQHVPELVELFGDRIVVAYSNPPCLGRLLVKAAH